MIAWTSPLLTSKLRPRRMGLSPTDACKFLISSNAITTPLFYCCHSRESGNPVSSTSLDPRLRGGDGLRLSDGAFEADGEQLLGFYGKFHREFFEHLLAETVDDHRDGVFG